LVWGDSQAAGVEWDEQRREFKNNFGNYGNFGDFGN
jgi:hypothetical protein